MNDFTVLGTGASPYHDLQIPAVMGSVYLITKSVALGLWVLFFYGESLRLKVQALQHALPGTSASAPKYGDFLWRAFALLLSLTFLYSWTFLKIVSLCDHIAMLISNEQQWADALVKLSSRTDGTISLMGMSVPQLLGAIAYSCLELVEDVFVSMRFVFLCLLYCIGPIAWAFSISELGIGVLRGWFKTVWQVSFWLVVFSVVKAAIIPLVLNALKVPTDLSAQTISTATILPVVYGLVILAATFMIPSLTEAVFSGGHLGTVAGAAMSIISYESLQTKAGHATDLAKMGGAGAKAGWSAGKAGAARGWSGLKALGGFYGEGLLAQAQGQGPSGSSAAGGAGAVTGNAAAPSTGGDAKRTR